MTVDQATADGDVTERLTSADPEAVDAALHDVLIAVAGSRADPRSWLAANRTAFAGVVTALQNARSSKTLELACRCLEALAPAVGYERLMAENLPLVVSGLNHPEPRLQKVALAIVWLSVDANQTAHFMASPAFSPTIRCVGSDSLEVAQSAVELLCRVSTNENAAVGVFSPDGSAILTDLAEGSETLRFRVLELALRVGAKGDAAADLMVASGLFSSVIEDIESDDILCRLNGIEAIGKLLDYSAGFDMLERLHIFGVLLPFLRTPMDDGDGPSIDDALTRAACMKFFGLFATKRPHELFRLDAAIGLRDLLERHLDDFAMRPDVLDPTLIALYNTASSPAGLRLLLLGRDAESPQQQLGSGARRGPIDRLVGLARGEAAGSTRLVALQGLACILDGCPRDGGGGGFEQGADACRSWFEDFGGWRAAATLARSAFDDVRVAACALMCAAAKFAWGVAALAAAGDVVDFLLDRSLEKTALGKEWRYSVVQAITKNPRTRDFLAAPVVQRLAAYVQEGPFYYVVNPEVAFESS
ncbi:26S proteasome non-ATPase regulatory subunit 5 [Cladochytrium tenue]|nr:26S proteasome non-ATPase regulatory subunit 5 [Cladochytrium tenue]